MSTYHRKADRFGQSSTNASQRVMETSEGRSSPASTPDPDVLRALWSTRLEGLAIVSSGGTILHANTAFCDLFGYGAEMVGMPVQKLHLREADWERGAAILRGDMPSWKGLLRYARVDGSVLSAHVSLCQIRRAATEPPLLSVTVRDAGAPTVSEAELRLLRERMKESLAATPLAVVEWDLEGRIIHWNRSAERIFGWHEDEVLRRPFLPLIVPGLAQEQVKGVVSALLSGNLANSRNVNITKDGRAITCQWFNALLHDEHGEVIAVISQAADVTAEESATQSLRASQRLLSTIIDNSPTYLSVKDNEGRYLLSNRALEQLHGKSREEIQGKREQDLWPSDVAAARSVAHEQVLAGRKSVEREECIPGPEGPRTLAVVDFPVCDEAGTVTGVCSIATDITFRRKAEEERAALQKEIINAQQTALRELSSPLIPLAKGVLAMPLIGLVDKPRSQLIMEDLLKSVSETKVHTAIIDITGVRLVDSIVASALLAMARAAKLLGAEVILTGVSPAAARALVEVGFGLSGIVTLGTLETGIAHALKRRSSER